MLFKNKDLLEQYLNEGFVIIKLYNENTVNCMKNLYQKNYVKGGNGLLPSLRFGSAEENIRLHYEIGEMVKESLNAFFEDFDFVANHFITKTVGENNEFRLHQDWNVVNERQYIAAHIWSPLQPTNEENGGLFVVKKSHHFFKNYRSGSLGIPFIDSTEKLRKNIVSANLLPGDAIVYNQALFHGSYPNLSNEDRKVVLTSIKPSQAPMVYYHKTGNENGGICIELFEISPEILFEQVSKLEKGETPVSAISHESFVYSGYENRAIDNVIFEALATLYV
jgi:hypothetical protein